MLKRFFAKVFAFIIVRKIENTYSKSFKIQEKILFSLLKKASNTQFGIDHNFNKIDNYEFFKKNVPVRDYEEFSTYISKIKKGSSNILWPGKPLYFAKTSGTTSGLKYIPITKESMPNHINSSRNAFLFYINKTGKTNILDGKAIFIQGSPILEDLNGIRVGRLSGIVAHYVPRYLNNNKMPSWETNCIIDWEEKIEKICEETLNENMTVIGGIPSWVKMYFEKLIKKSNKKTLAEIFKNLSLYVFGGVNYEPYQKTFNKLIGKKIAYDPDSSGHISEVGKFNSIISNEPVLVKQLFFNETKHFFKRYTSLIKTTLSNNRIRLKLQKRHPFNKNCIRKDHHLGFILDKEYI